MPRNIELKARCPDLPLAASRSKSLGAREAGILNQVDTYYHVKQGRLKLRTIDNDRAELIFYHRDNSSEVRPSDYQIVAITDPAALNVVLSQSLGVIARVRKRRRLLLWENVRIHLDDVDQLGTFLEFEAVVSPAADEATSHRRVAELRAALQISDADLIDSSYSDLLLKRL